MTRYPAVETVSSIVQVGFSRLAVFMKLHKVHQTSKKQLATNSTRSSHERPRSVYELGGDL